MTMEIEQAYQLTTKGIENDQDKRMRWLRELADERGKRYADCRLENFEVTHDKQRDALRTIVDFCTSIEEKIKQGRGVVLFGSKGTGKDHLMMGIAWHCIRVGFNVEWVNGADMRGDVRDSTKSDDRERDYVKQLLAPKVLWISDPLPVTGPLSDAQQDRLFRIIDGRYSRMKPTLVTVNVASRQELEARIGAQTADRLCDDSLAVFCDWPSYRKVMQ